MPNSNFIAQGFTLLDNTGNPYTFNNLFPASAQVANNIGNVSGTNPLQVSEETTGVQVNNSATGAAAAAVAATLPGAAGKTTYIRGFCVSTTNPAAAVSGIVTVTGLIGGTLSFEIVESVAQGGLLPISFGNAGLAASAQNTPIVVNLPAIAGGGAGAVAAWGVQI